MNHFLLEHPFILSLLIFTVVVLVKVFLSIFFIKEPMHWFRFFCSQLANKVNNPKNNPHQQKIAGALSTFITLLPLLLILWLFESFIEVNWLWHAFLLYFALGSFGLTRATIKTAKALLAKNTSEAKQLIAPFTLRNTDKLSPLGISKTSIEMHLLQTMQQCFSVAFFYFIFGPYAALTFRLLLEMHYSWNIKLPKYRAFGALVNNLVQILQWLPTRLFVLFLMLGTVGQNSQLFWQLIKQHFFSLNNAISVYALALAIEKKLGGVALYEDTKLRRNSFNDKALEPDASSIVHAVKRVNQVLYFSFLCLIFSSALTLVLTLKV